MPCHHDLSSIVIFVLVLVRNEDFSEFHTMSSSWFIYHIACSLISWNFLLATRTHILAGNRVFLSVSIPERFVPMCQIPMILRFLKFHVCCSLENATNRLWKMYTATVSPVWQPVSKLIATLCRLSVEKSLLPFRRRRFFHSMIILASTDNVQGLILFQYSQVGISACQQTKRDLSFLPNHRNFRNFC